MEKNKETQLIEQGSIYFFYRPKVVSELPSKESPKSLEDIQRFYIVLKPEQDRRYRLLLIGKKRLPEIKKHEKYWGTVDFVTTNKAEIADAFKLTHYKTKTQGNKILPEAKPCGEGEYVIVKSAKKTYLAYKLVSSDKSSTVQMTFHIPASANYQISIKNQQLAGVDSGKEAQFPRPLKEKFKHLRFFPADPPDFLNYPGAEVLLVGISEQNDYTDKVIASSEKNLQVNSLSFLRGSPITKSLFES